MKRVSTEGLICPLEGTGASPRETGKEGPPWQRALPVQVVFRKQGASRAAAKQEGGEEVVEEDRQTGVLRLAWEPWVPACGLR